MARRDIISDLANIVYPLPDHPGENASEHDLAGWSHWTDEVARERDRFHHDREIAWDHGDVDPLLSEIAEAREAMAVAEKRLRLLLAYGREFVEPRPYKLDDLAVAGLRYTEGSRLNADRVATYDDLTVRRLKTAGAIVLGKTNEPEFGHKGITDNMLFGPTYNPWNRARTPGGSSGGSAAAVASGLAYLALGTDGGGSVRIPASFCGLAGHKPSIGRVPRVPTSNAFDTGWVIGHLLGYVLLGIALLRARVIPRWAAWLIIVSAPVMGPIAYGTGLGLLQVLGYVLVFIGSVPAAIAMLRRRDEPEPAKVPAAEGLTSTT